MSRDIRLFQLESAHQCTCTLSILLCEPRRLLLHTFPLAWSGNHIGGQVCCRSQSQRVGSCSSARGAPLEPHLNSVLSWLFRHASESSPRDCHVLSLSFYPAKLRRRRKRERWINQDARGGQERWRTARICVGISDHSVTRRPFANRCRVKRSDLFQIVNESGL